MNRKSKAYDPNCERSVLAGIFNYSDTYVDVSDLISQNSFTVESNSLIYSVLKYIYDKNLNAKVDIPLFLSEANNIGLGEFFKKEAEHKYLLGISRYAISEENIILLAKKLRKLQTARDLQLETERIYKSLDEITGAEDITEIIGRAENPIFDATIKLSQGERSEIEHLGDGIDEWLQNIEDNPTDLLGIDTGKPLFNMAIGGGLRRKTVTVLAARIKEGKSGMMDDIASYVAGVSNIPCLMLDSEMGTGDHRTRMLANLSNIAINYIETGKFSKNERAKMAVYTAKERIKKMPYSYVDMAGKNIDDILALARRWFIRNVGYDEYGNSKNGLIFYDYLKLTSESDIKNAKEYEAIGLLMQKLTNFAKKFDIPIFAGVQLNRSGIEEEHSGTLAQSDRISWLASSVTILRSKTPEEISSEPDGVGNKRLRTIFTRYGKGLKDGDYININFDGDYCRFTECGTKFEKLAKSHRQSSFGELNGDGEPVPF